MMSSFRFVIVFVSCLKLCFAATLCTPNDIAKENVVKLAKANNELAVNILRHLTLGSPKENIFFSPFSLSTAFGMLYYGTRGKAAKELRSALGYEASNLPDELIHTTFQQYLTETLPSQDPKAYVLNSANAALFEKSLNVDSSYKKDVQDLYQAVVEDADFATQNQQVLNEINEWVKEKTNGKIDSLLEELDPSTTFILLNAVYFKGTWKTQFEASRTISQKFYNNGQESDAKEIPMMKLNDKLFYWRDETLDAVELPYKGENISMLILLPKKRDGLKDVEEKLSLAKFDEIRSELGTVKVHLSLPKFNIEFSKDMAGDFVSMGAESIFTPGADFSGISSDKNMYVSQIMHKAVLEINEEGSEATGVTGLISNRMGLLSFEPVKFTVNHPFLFAIVDNRNDMILFIGRVTSL